MYKITPLLFSILLAITPIISMEREFDLQALPDAAAIIVVASCENKNTLRQTCKRFAEFASRKKNENILLQPSLQLTQEALDRYLLYYGALGNVAIVRNLLSSGANPNAPEDNGATLMHHAVRYGYDDIVKMLFEHSDLIKCDLSSIKRPTTFNGIERNQFGNNLCSGCASKPAKLLHNVIQQGWDEAVEYLLRHNVSANTTNKDNNSALYYATKCGYLNIMKLLLANGACVDNVWSVLYIAVEKGCTSAVQLLIDYYANVNERIDWNGKVHSANVKYNRTLYCAVQKGYAQIVKMLLEKGADVNAEVYINQAYLSRPLNVARKVEIKALLIKYGAEYKPIMDCILQ